MSQFPLPSHVHYELLLQMLEKKTIFAVNQEPLLREKVQQLIITLRKALSQQKQIETICQQTGIVFEHHWSLNNIIPEDKQNKSD